MDIKQALGKLIERQDLSQDEMVAVMRQVMTGEASSAQIGALLVALRMKGESIDEIAGAVRVMRELATKVEINAENLIDLVGTGGDGANLFNISTASTFVAAAAGVKVAKHGNRSVSSSTGSADVLEAAGVQLDITPQQVARCVEELGVGFMFAPSHHSAMKHAIGPRKELGQRTIFNILGPLTNPAGVKRQVVGVFSRDLCEPLAEVLGMLGSEHVLVVNADDGLDEISIATPTYVAEWKANGAGGAVKTYVIRPEDFGLEMRSLDGLSVDNADASLKLIQDALSKRSNESAEKAADIIALNAGAAIYVSGVADTLVEGVSMAQDAVGSGLAKEKITELAAFTLCQKEHA